MQFLPGQRWISNAEPELGLGMVLRTEGRNVQILFATAGVLRHYAAQAAPLARVEFRPGQRVIGKGTSFVVETIENANGLLSYIGEGQCLVEVELDDTQSVSSADDRLVSGRVDRADHFDFRIEALTRRAAALRSPASGLASSRIDLVGHQLRVAESAVARRPARVLLADEVGLGKTIEAGMILSSLLASGRVARVLVLVPESLVYQWFVEMLRRFNLSFSVFDEDRCEAIESGSDGRNPFQDEQWIIAGTGFASGSEKRGQQMVDAGWDLVVVDEAHHLAWTPEATSREYALVEQLAANTPSLLLLTATPEQLGRSGHFARLRLLDPARYHDLERYIDEADGYVALSRVAAVLEANGALDADQLATLGERLADDAELVPLIAQHAEPAIAARLLDALIDRHGTGRVIFRNRRGDVGGFPSRVPDLRTLDGSVLDDGQRQRLLAEFDADSQRGATELELDYTNDPRLPWLLSLLETHPDAKLLLICHTQAKVLALEEALRVKSGVGVARFHEGMTLVQRDRNAAWFADPDGARVLLCSEIGSEGRNFQFAHHLALWDLPLDPDLLEQRIGRLDRIGQKHDISIHAAAFTGTAQHALMRWHGEGVNTFRTSPSDGRELLKRYSARLLELARLHARAGEDTDAEIDALVAETAAAHAELSQLLQEGRDRLLEMASARQTQQLRLPEALAMTDADLDNDAFILGLFEQFGVQYDELGPRTVVLDPEYMTSDAFPGLKDGPQQVTFDRRFALEREDVPLLRLDHPMVTGALDLLLESEQGNAAFLVDPRLPARSALLECVFVLVCVADRKLGVERFLPPLPMRFIIDSRLTLREDYQPSPTSLSRSDERPVEVPRYRGILAKLVPPMLANAETHARRSSAQQIAQALAECERELGDEHRRLTALARVNPDVRQGEIDAIAAELESLRTALPQATLKLDAIRFICSPDFLSLR